MNIVTVSDNSYYLLQDGRKLYKKYIEFYDWAPVAASYYNITHGISTDYIILNVLGYIVDDNYASTKKMIPIGSVNSSGNVVVGWYYTDTTVVRLRGCNTTTSITMTSATGLRGWVVVEYTPAP